MAFDANASAARCRKAMKGLGTNDTALIKELTSLTRSQMVAVRVAFSQQFGRDLVADVKSETRANYKKAMVGLLLSPAEFDCMALNDACKGMGSNKHAITRIICTRTPAEMDAVQSSYRTMYGRALVDHIESESRGKLMSLYSKVLDRNPQSIARAEAEGVDKDVELLYKAGQGRMGTDENVFIRKLATTSRPYRDQIYTKYAAKYGKALDAVIKKECSGKFADALVALVTPLPLFFARQLKDAFKGAGTNNTKLIHIVCSQRGRYLAAACRRYLETYGTSVELSVTKECPGRYKKTLVAILQKEVSANGATTGAMGRELYLMAMAPSK